LAVLGFTCGGGGLTILSEVATGVVGTLVGRGSVAATVVVVELELLLDELKNIFKQIKFFYTIFCCFSNNLGKFHFKI
jgi:hypothetical protein